MITWVTSRVLRINPIYDLSNFLKMAIPIMTIFMKNFENHKVGCTFLMVILSDFRMRKYGDDDHEEDAPYFRK